MAMTRNKDVVSSGSCPRYLECFGSVEQVREVKVHDVVPCDDVRVHLLDKVTPRLVWV